MKNIALVFIMLMTTTSAFAHELPLPHGHDSFFHGWEMYVLLLIIPLVIVFGLKKIFSVLSKSKK